MALRSERESSRRVASKGMSQRSPGREQENIDVAVCGAHSGVIPLRGGCGCSPHDGNPSYGEAARQMMPEGNLFIASRPVCLYLSWAHVSCGMCV